MIPFFSVLLFLGWRLIIFLGPWLSGRLPLADFIVEALYAFAGKAWCLAQAVDQAVVTHRTARRAWKHIPEIAWQANWGKSDG
jgi:hypothetical protein